MSLASVPVGDGKHPILFVTISAKDMAASTAFYARVFGWHTHVVTPEISGAATPGGPNVALRSDAPAGFPPVVPFVGVEDVAVTLTRMVAAGGAVDREPWSVPMAGILARFRDPSGTIYGLTSALPPDAVPRVPMPFGSNPRPATGSICSIEMYAKDGAATGRLFAELFGWGCAETMPQYQGFDPGAGVGGVLQSHSPGATAVAYIYVSDVKATLDEIDANGGKRTGGAMPVPGMGTFGYFVDPSGSAMGLIGP